MTGACGSSVYSESFVIVAPTSANVARQYGRLYAALCLAGTPIPVNDMWIAATAIAPTCLGTRRFSRRSASSDTGNAAA